MSQPTDNLLIELDTIDSTNNYAMQLVDADKARPGLTIVANSQTGGKGQRGRSWIDTPGQSLLMSIITVPQHHLQQQFLFSAGVAVAIAKVLQNLDEGWQVRIKWPNDIIINDKKAGGILIENILRGSRWTHSVIGLGLNIHQVVFPQDIPHATSLKIASGLDFNKQWLRDYLREHILMAISVPKPEDEQMRAYNHFLFRQGEQQVFSDANGTWSAGIVQALADGTLEVQLHDGTLTRYVHGQVTWQY